MTGGALLQHTAAAPHCCNTLIGSCDLTQSIPSTGLVVPSLQQDATVAESALLQRTAATHCGNTLRKHTAETHCCDILQRLRAQTCGEIRRVIWPTIFPRLTVWFLHHVAATRCCNTLLQHTAATHCCNTLLGSRDITNSVASGVMIQFVIIYICIYIYPWLRAQTCERCVID